MPPNLDLIARIDAALRATARPELAPAMQAYMKSTMPYLGVRRPDVRRIARAEEKTRAPRTSAELAETSLHLWRTAEFREQRYVAAELTDTATARSLQDMSLLPLYREIITTGAWWDHVDDISHRVGGLLTHFPQQMQPILLTWATDDDLWVRRSAIIAQLGFKDRLDADLLSAVLAPNLDHPDFFIRKAIGWALREYARVEPDWVRGYVAQHDLSPLSRREALKHLL